MSRTIPLSLMQELTKASQDAIIIPFLTFSSLETAESIYIVADGAQYVLNGNTFEPIPFDFALLPDTDATPEVQLSVPNIDREVGDKIIQILEPISLTLELYDADDFDLTEDPRTAIGSPSPIYTASELLLRDVTVDAFQVTGTVKGWDIRGEYSTKLRATQDRFPALYR
jgi:hypothetical protein